MVRVVAEFQDSGFGLLSNGTGSESRLQDQRTGAVRPNKREMTDPKITTDARARELLESVKGPMPDAISRLEAASKRLPADADFHFYSSFPQFKRPLQELAGTMSALLTRIGTAKELRSEPSKFVDDPDEVHDWLIGLQDDLLEKVGGALDEFQRLRNEQKRRKGPDFDEVAGQSRKKMKTASGRGSSIQEEQKLVKIAKRGNDAKSSVPTCIASIPRPQDKFDVAVDNSNTAFVHPTKVLVKASASDGEIISDAFGNDKQDGAEVRIAQEAVSIWAAQGGAAVHLNHFVESNLQQGVAKHPLQDELRSLQYSDGSLLKVEPEEPQTLSATPFTFVDTVTGLKSLAAKLSTVQEIAVDLEHHHYRSFQGIVCLMQISTRTEDFIVDTLALRSHIGPCLGAVFSDSDIKKVMHGADRDVVWLQRDFGIYLCNLFDTGQAARILELPGFGLAFLLQHFCGVTADKRYQLADWRLRPLTPDMMRYAREDTHYLLYIYDRLRQLLIDARAGKPKDPLLLAFECSRAVCLKLYEKELLTAESHLQIYGLAEKKLRPLQLGVLAELYAWRDEVARNEDESTGFVCPNKLLIQLAEEMPQTMQELQRLAKGVRTLVHKQPGTIVSIIRSTKETFLSRMGVQGDEPSVAPANSNSTENSQLQEGKFDGGEGEEPDVGVLRSEEEKCNFMQAQKRGNRLGEYEKVNLDTGEREGLSIKLSQCEGVETDVKDYQKSSVEVSPNQGIRSDSRNAQNRELDPAGADEGGAVTLAEHERPVNTGTLSTFREEASVGRAVCSPAIVRRAMVSSLFGPRSRSSISKERAPSPTSEAVPSQSNILPAEVNSDGTKTCSAVVEETAGNPPVTEQLMGAQASIVVAECMPVASAPNGLVDGKTSSGIQCGIAADISLDMSRKTALLDRGPCTSVQINSLQISDCETWTSEDHGSLAADCTAYAAGGNLRCTADEIQVDSEAHVSLAGTATSEKLAICTEEFPQKVQARVSAARHSGGFALLLGRSSKKENGSEIADRELMEARRKAEEIKSSVSLPFHGGAVNFEDVGVSKIQTQSGVADMSSMTVLQKLGVKVRDKGKLPLQESRQWGDEVSFEVGEDRPETGEEYQHMPDSGEQQHRWAGRVSETSHRVEGRLEELAGTSSSLPTPLSEARRISNKGQDGVDMRKRAKGGIPRLVKYLGKKRKAMGTQTSNSEQVGTSKSKKKRPRKADFKPGSAAAGSVGVAIPFDYEAAKQALGVGAQLSRNRSDDLPHGRLSGKRKQTVRKVAPSGFDPYRKGMTEPKPEGIRPGNRRQVFPQSGNRSMTFK